MLVFSRSFLAIYVQSTSDLRLIFSDFHVHKEAYNRNCKG